MYDPGRYMSVITAIVFIKKLSRWFTRLYACVARIRQHYSDTHSFCKLTRLISLCIRSLRDFERKKEAFMVRLRPEISNCVCRAEKSLESLDLPNTSSLKTWWASCIPSSVLRATSRVSFECMICLAIS